MRKRLAEHIAGIAFVGLILSVFSLAVTQREDEQRAVSRAVFDPLLSLPSVDLGNPLHEAMLRETLSLYFPESPSRADSIVDALMGYRQRMFTDPALKSGGAPRGLSSAVVVKIGLMYVQFLLVFAAAMLLSYLGARTLALYRFMALKQGRLGLGGRLRVQVAAIAGSRSAADVARRAGGLAGILLMAAVRALVYLILFSPAFVVAYAVRTRIDTSTIPALIILAVLTNGLLISSANRLFTLLVAESRKGYVLTAIVKNLDASYRWGERGGMPWNALFRPGNLEASHVFHHIYLNARYQYVPAIKEHATLLVTGLIIIEMALNIQNHLGYELLQAILLRDVPVIAVIVFGIYLLVKTTEVLVDTWFSIASRRYENSN